MAATVVPRRNIALLAGRGASYAHVLAEIERGEYDLVHFSGHVGTDAGEPFLLLADGHVRGAELVTLLSRRPPAVFVVNGRGAIRLPLVGELLGDYARTQPTGEVLEAEAAGTNGFAWVAARAGVGVFVGGFGLLTDEHSAQFGIAFYQRLLAGQPAADAFWAARGNTYRSNPDAYSFIMSGYPDLVLCLPRPDADRARRKRA